MYRYMHMYMYVYIYIYIYTCAIVCIKRSTCSQLLYLPIISLQRVHLCVTVRTSSSAISIIRVCSPRSLGSLRAGKEVPRQHSPWVCITHRCKACNLHRTPPGTSIFGIIPLCFVWANATHTCTLHAIASSYKHVHYAYALMRKHIRCSVRAVVLYACGTCAARCALLVTLCDVRTGRLVPADMIWFNVTLL